MSLYTKDMKAELRKITSPYNGVIVDHVEHYETGQMEVRVYENNIMDFNNDQRIVIMQYLERLRDVYKRFGINAFIDGVAGDPPQLRKQ